VAGRELPGAIVKRLEKAGLKRQVFVLQANTPSCENANVVLLIEDQI
jgi:hypothetical protein